METHAILSVRPTTFSHIQLKNAVFAHPEFLFIDDASHSVGQNVYFTDASLPARGWGTKVVRRWFLEGNQLNESIWEQYSTGQVRFNELGNFTQLMWPNTEFVGCAGAE